MGSSLTYLDYESTADTLSLGGRWQLSEGFRLEIRGSWTEADAALAPFDFDAPEMFLSTFRNSSYDFTGSYLNSDLAVTSWDVGLEATWEVSDRYAIVGTYRHLDYQDDAPYRVDTSGEVDFVGLGGRWRF